MSKTEQELVQIAEWNDCDKKANAAMKELREKYDETYTWCCDCDGLVVKEKYCCNNKDLPIDDENIIF